MAAVFLLVVFLVLLLLGFPIVVSMGSSALLYVLLFIDTSPIVVVRQMLSGVDSFTLLAIPFFIMAGGYMQHGGISKRIINVAKAVVGSLPGGLALVTIWSSVIFGSMTGSGSATSAAIGSLMIPALKNDGYDEDFACALQSVSGMFGPLIPPSILMVLFATSSGTSVSDMLLSGIFPGLLLAGMLSCTALYICRKHNWRSDIHFDFINLVKAIGQSVFALFVPVIILGGIYSGIFTPTEAAAVGCLYSLLVGFFIYREIAIRNLLKITTEALKTTGMTILIVSTSQAFVWVLTRERIPQRIANFFVSISNSSTVFLFCVAVLVLIIGCFIEAPPAVLVLAPMLTPTAVAYGIDPVHFGVVMVTGLVVGLATPPVGACLFVVSGVAKRPMQKFVPKLIPFLITCLLGYLIVIVCPALATFLPGLMN